MAEHSISTEEAQNDLLKSAVYLSEKIGSTEARAAAVETILPFFLENDEVDFAASLADSVDDPFVRDKLLSDVVAKCAEIDDDEYALQLIDAIDEHATRNTARERMLLQKASKGQFDAAITISENLDHPAEAFAGIAVNQARRGFFEEAEKTLELVDFFNARVDARQEIALIYRENGKPEKASSMLERATVEAEEIEFTEDKIRSLFGIGSLYIEAEQNDKAISVFARARETVEGLDGFHKDNLFVQVAQGFLRAGSIDLADRTLDLVADKTQIADCLIGFSQVFRTEDDPEDALESLEEAYAILQSQTDMEIRSSKARFQLFTAIAKEFALLGKVERAIEVAHENPDPEQKNFALTQIAQICTLSGNDDFADQAIKGIEDDVKKTEAFVAVADAYVSIDKRPEGREILERAASMLESIPQFIMRGQIQNEITKRLYKLGDHEKARALAAGNLLLTREIRGEGNRAVALAELSEIYRENEFSLSDEDRDVVRALLSG